VGDGAGLLVERALAASSLPADMHGEALRAFLAFYAEDPIQHTQLYPGVLETLERLAERGHALALCTNKPEAPAREILERMHLAQYFAQVAGGDTFPFRKPDPRMLLALLEPSGTAPERAVLVGDSEVDAATAHNAQVPFVLMSYGYHRTPLAQISSHAVLDDLRALPDLLV
jgi:phosphoglycolate phosphatase